MDAKNPHEDISSIVVAPEDAGARIRASLGLAAGEELRISYITGPGDVQGTYEHWLAGELDPRVPTVAKTAMLYELCRHITARAQLVADVQPECSDFDDGNVRFDYIQRHRFSGALSYHWACIRRVYDARQAIKRFSPHFVIACTDFPSYGLPVLKTVGAKLIFSLHNTFWTKGLTVLSAKERLANFGREFWLQSADAALCTSLECELQFQRLTKNKITTFRNIPQQRRPASPVSVSKPGKIRKILFLGRIENAKGIYDLLDAYVPLSKKYHDIELVFAGAGAAAQALTNRIEELGDDRVRYVGKLSANEVFAELKGTYVTICPTRIAFKEGLALVCIEAAVYGVPSIMSTAVPAAYLLPDSGEVYAADSVEGLTEALDKFLQDPAFRTRRSQNALTESQNFFRRDKSWGSYLYQAMLEAASG